MKRAVFTKIYVKRSDCIVFSTIKGFDIHIDRIYPKEEYTDHIINSSISNSLKSKLSKNGVKVINVGDGKIWARAKSCSSCSYFNKTQALVLGANAISSNEIVYSLIVLSRQYLKDMLKELNDLGFKPIVHEIHDIYENKKNRRDLSIRQLQVLLLAYRKGYFDVDRKVTLTEIAKILDIAPSSAEELLRRALLKVIDEFIKNFEKI